MARLNVLLVGAGSMGSLHARVTAQSEHCVLHTVVDPLADLGQDLATRLGAAPNLADDLVVFAHPVNEFGETDYELPGQYFVVPGGPLTGVRTLPSFLPAGSLLAPPVDLAARPVSGTSTPKRLG